MVIPSKANAPFDPDAMWVNGIGFFNVQKLWQTKRGRKISQGVYRGAMQNAHMSVVWIVVVVVVTAP